jgi:3-oxoacyl-[acyl-carrier protein] reductase
MKLQACRTLITGASRGLGRAIAYALAREGGKLGINYAGNLRAAEETAAEVRRLGGEAILLKGDVAVKADAERITHEFVAGYQGVDILVNNAGMNVQGSIQTLTDEAWQRGLDVHLNGAFYCTRAALPYMMDKRSGSILVMSSVAGFRGVPNIVGYAVVKAGLIAFTRCVAMDVADYNIRVNALCPGLIDTDFHASTTPERREHNIKNRVPLHRYGTADEVAEAALALLRNDFITGETLTIDGGMSMRIV